MPEFNLFRFILFQKIYRNRRFFSVLSAAGTYTTGIYILQVIILERLINRLIDFPDVNIYVYNFLLTPLTALSTGIICIFAIGLISVSKTASTVLFGKQLFVISLFSCPLTTYNYFVFNKIPSKRFVQIFLRLLFCE